MLPIIVRQFSACQEQIPFSVLKPHTAFVVSVAHGLVVSGLLILLLPAAFDAQTLWFAMPITELLVAVCAAARMRSDTHALPATEG